MCKYCRLKEINKKLGELTSDNLTIGKLRDGSRLSQVYINRYIVATEDIHRSELVIEDVVKLSNNEMYSLHETRVKIKYCPFCGEEL